MGAEGTVSSVRAAGPELELVGESAAGCDLNFPHGSLVHRVLHLHLAQRLCSFDHLPANNTNSNSEGAGSPANNTNSNSEGAGSPANNTNCNSEGAGSPANNTNSNSEGAGSPANNTISNSEGAGSVGGVTCQQHQQQQ